MNKELRAMNKISNAVESSTADLDVNEKARVLGWFRSWLDSVTPDPVVAVDRGAITGMGDAPDR